jgi:hypothetical protein
MHLCSAVFSYQWILRHLSAALCPPSVLPNSTAILHWSKICLLGLKLNKEREEITMKYVKFVVQCIQIANFSSKHFYQRVEF